ncbi:hypothetical protein H1D32_14725 [Anaerobacillus sp. CMMVII]|uniref:hypothetical protein n=1 Tax=Anaerobacillus sp. CMMVII TaxID=2755588 RepID=UPI0021B712D6|nr:hypothetical protein [Anaerobacillus sp. CMMVII]MCT8138858.1 hypothetical protein [Anaerobacillus sp. CMMVII]
MKKRIVLLIIGFWCLKKSLSMFPSFEQYRLDIILQVLLFEPFKLLGATVLYILGFLAIARVIKRIYEQIMVSNSIKKELLWIIVIGLLFLYISLESVLATLVSVGFSLFYGIMDANIQRKSRYFNS